MRELSMFLLGVVVVSALTLGQADAQDGVSQVCNCQALTLTKPSMGVAYRGTIRNSDYHLRTTIPEGLTGWGGVASEAPFHGFVVFLPGKPQGCINFEIQIRIEDAEEAQSREKMEAGKKVRVGNIDGWETRKQGLVEGTEWTNVRIRFSVFHGKEIDDGSVTLATPTRDLNRNLPIFRKFVSEIIFDGTVKSEKTRKAEERKAGL